MSFEELYKRRRGIPRSNVERVMRHYNVSEAEAERMIIEKGITALLPPRGYGLEIGRAVGSPMTYEEQYRKWQKDVGGKGSNPIALINVEYYDPRDLADLLERLEEWETERKGRVAYTVEASKLNPQMPTLVEYQRRLVRLLGELEAL